MQATIVLSRGEAVLQVVSEGHAEAQLLGELERQIERSGPRVVVEEDPKDKVRYLRLRANAPAARPEPAAEPKAEPAPAATIRLHHPDLGPVALTIELEGVPEEKRPNHIPDVCAGILMHPILGRIYVAVGAIPEVLERPRGSVRSYVYRVGDQ